ncbi:MAG: UDP-N-acetylmuramoyl-L-alanine--D-glutamate ligase [Pseudomonadota bacterium]
MIAVTTFAGKRVAVFGLGGSGLATARALVAGGAEVVCGDDKTERVKAAAAAGLPTGDLREADFAAFDALVLSPGVPLTHPKPHWTVERADAADVEVIGDIELFDRERRARFPQMKLVAITGTNGKSTTTALTGHLLSEMGEDAQVGGNIGRPVLELDPERALTVLEVSSYQIDLSPTLAPDVGVLLNITEDHIDLHGSFENYANIKKALINQSAVAVLGHHSLPVNYFARTLPCTKNYGFCADRFTPSGDFTRRKSYSTRDVFWQVDYDGAVVAASRVQRETFDAPPHLRDVHVGWDLYAEEADDGETPFGAMPDVASLRGDHNAQNAAAALAILMALQLDYAAAVPHLATFPGLPHRMEEVGRAGSVLFINDSKATNAEAARPALNSFEDIHWIAGGVPKEGGIAPLKSLFPRLARAYLIGQAAADFGATLAGKVDARQCGTLDRAFGEAADAAAREGGVVLLSPACASFDQFRSFEARGDAFRALVKQRLEASNG